MELLRKINFKQPKYMLPALVYLPLLFTGYFLIDMFHTKKAEIEDPTMQSTEYLNPNLPKARVKEELEGKYESMVKSFGKIDDISAVATIDREDKTAPEENYQSHYSEDDLAAIEENAARQAEAEAKLREMERRLAESARKGEEMGASNPFPLTEKEMLIQSQQREKELQDELEQLLAQTREEAASKMQNQAVEISGTITVNENAVSQPAETSEAQEVVKRSRQSSDYFNTISENEPQSNMIKAIIDEDIRAVDGSRVRLRLLDDIVIGNITMPRGSYLYAIMSGFGSQRVKGTVQSLLYQDQLIKVSLSLYDTDGLEGLYVPESAFRETTKDVASGAMSSNMSINQGGYDHSLAQWGMQVAQNAYQRTTNAISKAIKRNKAKLKYGTFVYLVNGKETQQQ